MDARISKDQQQWLESLFRESEGKLKVLALLCGGSHRPTSYYRLVQPLAAIGDAHKLSTHFVISEGPAGTGPLFDWADVAIFQQFNPLYVQGLAMARQKGMVTVFETDDFLPDIPAQVGHQRAKWESFDIAKYYKWMCNNADYVWVSSEHLGERIRRWTKEEPIFFPNALPYDRAPWNVFRTEHEGVNIGYMGSLSHATDVREAVAGLQKVLSRKDVHLYYCGVSEEVDLYDPRTDKVTKTTVDRLPEEVRKRTPICVIKSYFDILSGKVTYKEWEPLESYPLLYRDFDLVIVPLDSNEFNRCKSSIKVAEAGAFNLPVIATNIEPYYCIDHYVDGFLVTKPKKWGKYLNSLAIDGDRRTEMGQKLGEKARRLFNLSDWTEKRYKWLMQFHKTIETPKVGRILGPNG